MQISDYVVRVAAEAAFYATPRNRKFENLSAFQRRKLLTETRAVLEAALPAIEAFICEDCAKVADQHRQFTELGTSYLAACSNIADDIRALPSPPSTNKEDGK